MLKETIAQSIIEKGLSHGADFVDIFVEKNHALSINVKSSKVEQISDGIDFGLGIRVVFGEKALYGYTNTTEIDELIRITNYLCELDRRDPRNTAKSFNLMKGHQYSQVRLGLDQSVKVDDKIAFLKNIDQKTRNRPSSSGKKIVCFLSGIQRIQRRSFTFESAY